MADRRQQRDGTQALARQEGKRAAERSKQKCDKRSGDHAAHAEAKCRCELRPHDQQPWWRQSFARGSRAEAISARPELKQLDDGSDDNGQSNELELDGAFIDQREVHTDQDQPNQESNPRTLRRSAEHAGKPADLVENVVDQLRPWHGQLANPRQITSLAAGSEPFIGFPILKCMAIEPIMVRVSCIAIRRLASRRAGGGRS